MGKDETNMRIGLVGFGSIGQTIVKAILDKRLINVELKVVAEIQQTELLSSLSEKLGFSVTDSFDKLLNYDLDIVVEAASQEVAKMCLPVFLEKGISVIVVSVGALTDIAFYERLNDIVNKSNCRLYIPSGAIGGLDILLSAKEDRLDSVTLITRKPPKSLENTAGINKSINIKSTDKPIIVYEGCAAEAVKLFPKNINVAASISLAGLGADNTTVKIVADPNSSKNIHELEVEGAFGKAKIIIENKPSPINPKTSHLAALSVIALIKKINQKIIIGN